MKRMLPALLLAAALLGYLAGSALKPRSDLGLRSPAVVSGHFDIPREYRGQPIEGGQTFKVKPGDWLLIPPDTPHQPKPDPSGFSYMIMKINVGSYPWALIR